MLNRTLLAAVAAIASAVYAPSAAIAGCSPGVVATLPDNANLASQLCGDERRILVPSEKYGGYGAPSGHIQGDPSQYEPPAYQPQSATSGSSQQYFPAGSVSEGVCSTNLGVCSVLSKTALRPGTQCYCATAEGRFNGVIK